VGDFPRRFEFVRGNMEVAEWNGARFLRISQGQSRFAIVLAKPLPGRFTLEFDAVAPPPGSWAEIRFAPKTASVVTFREFTTLGEGGIGGTGATALGRTAAPLGPTGREVLRVRVMADGQYAKVYLNGTRVANVPNADLGRSERITFDITHATNDQPMLIGGLRLMAGGRKLYDALAEKGRVATQGIYFDSGSDRIRPESAPTLREIAAMLAEHGDLSLTIEGHTDNAGSEAANQALSERRATSVRDALVTQFGVDPTRLSAKGVGPSQPIAPNTTPEGRQANRRVELVKS
jgi:outer membrane protein OmpA-like peptidoglycan-associated protein